MSKSFERTTIAMKLLRAALGLLPFVGILGGVFFVNRVEPVVLGFPFLFFWIIAWTLGTALIMVLVYLLDPKNKAKG
ncbi:MAG: DUF3311 domain-containing protein [Gammaproteobacteria bacterium]